MTAGARNMIVSRSDDISRAIARELGSPTREHRRVQPFAAKHRSSFASRARIKLSHNLGFVGRREATTGRLLGYFWAFFCVLFVTF